MSRKNILARNDNITLCTEHVSGGKQYKIHTSWVVPTVKETNDMIEDLFSGKKIHLNFIDDFVFDWDLKDDDGKAIPCDKLHKGMLPSHVAAGLNNLFSKKIGLLPMNTIEQIEDSLSEMKKEF